jgi:hypothetical protein
MVSSIPPNRINQFSNTLGKTVREVSYAVNRHEPVTYNLAFSQIRLALPVLYAFLYRAGQAVRTGEEEIPHKLMNALVEGGITYGIIRYTKGLYPLLGLGWAVFEMGKEETPVNKIKAGLKAAILFPLGYLGINSAVSYTEKLHYWQAQTMLPQLGELKHALTNATSLPAAELLPHVDVLAANHRQLVRLFEIGATSSRTISKVVDAIGAAEGALMEKIADLNPVSLDKPVTEALHTMTLSIADFSHYRLFRVANPILGYLLATSIIGIPLFKVLLNKLIPEASAEKQEWSDITPMWMHHMPRLGSHRYRGNAFQNADGPALLRQYGV